MDIEEPKRWTPSKETFRQLFAYSGNLCAFPNCKHYLLNEHGQFVGQVCHIEGVKGERFNPNMTNEQRRQPSNLVLMCYPHHIETNDEQVWTVERMREVKEQHESRFRHPEKAILAGLRDWTKVENPVLPFNLKALIKQLNLPLEGAEEEAYFKEVTAYIERFKGIPLETRAFLGRVMERIYDTEQMHMKIADFGGHSASIPAEDIRKVFDLSRPKLDALCDGLHRYRVGNMDEGVDSPDINIHHIKGISFWYDAIDFCRQTNHSSEALYEDLDFSSLQSA